MATLSNSSYTGTATVTFNTEEALRLIRAEVAKEVNKIVVRVHQRAVRLAPVRRVFKGRRQKVTSYGQAMRQLGISAKTNLKIGRELFGAGYAQQPFVRMTRSPSNLYHPHLRTVSGRMRVFRNGREIEELSQGFSPREGRVYHLESRVAQMHLNRQGRYELAHATRKNSAVYKGVLGGRLRDSISFIAARADDLTGTVYAAAPYAKYVEFGTRHAAAQPFLRPALMAERR